VHCESAEFTCVCPLTGQPDFATVMIEYVPDQAIVELKSLKLYLWSYRDEGAFHEDVTNRILDDLVATLAPRRARVTTDWKVRGGIHTVVSAEHPGSAPEGDD
jgi:7-cyano-7-deazaguanine reductase